MDQPTRTAELKCAIMVFGAVYVEVAGVYQMLL